MRQRIRPQTARAHSLGRWQQAEKKKTNQLKNIILKNKIMLTDLLKSHFLNLYHIALCDMQIEPVELEKLYSIGIEKGISTSEIDSIVLHPDKKQRQ